MKTLILIVFSASIFFAGCEKDGHGPTEGGGRNLTRNYRADVALKWINLQQKLIKTTPGFDPLVASRSFAYSGVTLYESVLKGMPSHKSIASPRVGLDINALSKHQHIHWAASANAAMAFIMKNLFANTSPENQFRIDSLESTFTSQFQSEATTKIVQESAEYGRRIANRIFEWSKTDGGHQAYLAATNSNYAPPTGEGLWIPTPAAYSQPIRPYWGSNRSFISDIATTTMPPAPPAYSALEGSEFYRSANDVYTTSLTLSEEDIRMVKHWADLPGNYGTPAHYTHIATQLIQKESFMLDKAALTYAKHGIALNEALICVFKAKYTYNLIRPISYIRSVLGHSDWLTVVGTPPHPEYPSAHAVVGGASVAVLQNIFGKNYSFVDRTHEELYGSRSYSELKAYAIEAARSRYLGGIHYKFSADIGLVQGNEVGSLVNAMGFTSGLGK